MVCEGHSILSDILRHAITQLKKAGVATPDLDARLFMEAVLGKDHAFIVLHPEYRLSAPEGERYKTMLARRIKREPLAKILGIKEFWSLPFKTTAHTLDPRPDSEALIEAVLKVYSDRDQPYRILDLGTGTGCLLLSLLSEFKTATGVGADISPKALEVAHDNAKALGVGRRASFVHSNWLENIEGTFDIIISNPPYIPPSHRENLEPELAFDPESALYGEEKDDGLTAYKTLATQIFPHLAPGGKIFFEFGKNQHNDVETIMKANGFRCLNWFKDLSGSMRCGLFSS